MLRIALTKGRLERSALRLFEAMGFSCEPLQDKGRKLIVALPENGVEVVFAKAADVVTYVEHGVCDIGITGKDTIMEHGKSFYEVLDLGFGKCRMIVAAKDPDAMSAGYSRKKIASKYPKIAETHFMKKDVDAEIIKIEGSVELAPILGLADAIVDITETGTTIRENGLTIIEDVCPVSARLIINTASMKLKKDEIAPLIEDMRLALEVMD